MVLLAGGKAHRVGTVVLSRCGDASTFVFPVRCFRQLTRRPARRRGGRVGESSVGVGAADFVVSVRADVRVVARPRGASPSFGAGSLTHAEAGDGFRV